MKLRLFQMAVGILTASAISSQAATFYVDLNSANPTPPYSDWSTAATNIQDAINAASDGDQIWVTNGVYQTGGLAMAGTLTNRVALNKAVTVQSVNGPLVTIIQGAGATNGAAAVRCAWLTNNASLIGFTITFGATETSGDPVALESGGGVWCASSNATVTDCIIVSNTAFNEGDGAYQGTLNKCLVSRNGSSFLFGAAVYSANLNNCTVVSNTVYGANSCRATNSIIYYSSSQNYSGGSLSYCCTTPTAPGAGNFTNAPQLIADGIHLSRTSPCIGTGTTPNTTTDIFGNPWANPPSIGCAEVPNTPVVTQPSVQLTGTPVGFTVGNAGISAAGSLTFNWLKDGVLLQDNGHFSFTQSNNLVATGVSFADAGGYQLVVSNTFGAATSAVAQVVIHCVDANGANPVAPYTNWMTAATNIQDAITAAAAQDIVLVTNGVYATGGKSMDGVITNRMSLDKAVLVQGVNGPSATVIRGTWDPVSTNGPGAVRCVWMTNNSILNGFTVTGGATYAITNPTGTAMSGGGIWASTNTIVWDCVIGTNYASLFGGGVYSATLKSLATLNSCVLVGNHVVGSGTAGTGIAGAGSGGGAYQCNLRNCVIASNSADQSDGGGAAYCNATNCAFIGNRAVQGNAVYWGNFVNCTIANNTWIAYAGSGGSAVYGPATLINSIVYGNYSVGTASTNYAYNCTFTNCDTDPLPSGSGNIDTNPQLLADNIHLAPGSPCIGAGTNTAVSGTDIDGQPWNNPPSIGCDEWQPVPVVDQISFQAGVPTRRLLGFNVIAAGQPPFSYYWSKDGTLIQNSDHYSNSGTNNLTVNGFEPEDAGAYQVVVSNAFGMVTSQVAQVVIHAVNASSASPVAPYTNWLTAAAQIQDAIDAANPGDIVLVTNGNYATGGRVMSGDLTNRVALNKPLTVISVNGYAASTIQGAWDSAATNGPGAVRCAWLASGATLNGFTLQNGATRGGNFITFDLQYGGGAWLSTNAVVCNCAITNNSAYYSGGGVAFGTINNSFLAENTAQLGAGAYQSVLDNCTVFFNVYSSSQGAGVQSCSARNCIVLGNNSLGFPFSEINYVTSTFQYSCTDPLPNGGTGNIDTGLALLDSTFHLSAVSPIRGAGSSLYASGTDMDDQLWANPPSMGCSELVLSNLVGPITVVIRPGTTDPLVNHIYGLLGAATGRVESLTWSFGDGSANTNAGRSLFHTWTNAGNFTITLTAYNLDNPSGVSTNMVVVVDALNPPALGSAGMVSNSFQFNFLAQTSAMYTVQYATNLTAPVTWQTLQTIFFSGGGETTIADPSVTNAVRFYRVQVQ